MNHPLNEQHAELVIQFQNTAAWQALIEAAHERLRRMGAQTMASDVPDVAAAKAHHRAGAEYALDLLCSLPRDAISHGAGYPPIPAANTPQVPQFLDMSDFPRAPKDTAD